MSTAYSYHFHDTEVDYSTAVSNCLAQGQTLAMPKSQLEFDTLMATVNNDPSWTNYPDKGPTGGITFGLLDEDRDQVFAWIDGSPLAWTYWHNGQPNHYRGNQHCGYIYELNNAMKWGDVDCVTLRPYVCQKGG